MDRPLIAHGLYSFRIGGSERVGAQLCIEYAARGYGVVCFAYHGSTGPFRDYLESNGIECVDLNYLTRLPKIRRLTYQLELYNFFRRRRVHALHVHHAVALTLCGRPASWAGVKHLVMTEHAIFQLQERDDYRRSSARDCRYASAITGVHDGIIEYFHSQMGVPTDRLHVVHNGVPQFSRDRNSRRRKRAELNLRTDAFICLYVGRLEAVKDLGTLLHAVAQLSETVRRRIHLLLAGDGSERPALEDLCRSLDLTEIVEFLGERSDISELLEMADAFVMTSRTEGLPMALIEAMSAGLPCIATAVGGIPSLLSNESGLLVAKGDSSATAHAISMLVENSHLCEVLSQRARETVETKFGLEPVVTKYLGLMGLPARWPPDKQ